MIKLKYQELSCLKETHFIKNKEYLDQKKEFIDQRIIWMMKKITHCNSF